jgi:hypothetical protein
MGWIFRKSNLYSSSSNAHVESTGTFRGLETVLALRGQILLASFRALTNLNRQDVSLSSVTLQSITQPGQSTKPSVVSDIEVSRVRVMCCHFLELSQWSRC